jgi:hypothetical protein
MLAILAAVMLAAAPQTDTVFTADGGRLIGTVVEEGPQGITVQLPDGTSRRLARAEVSRIEYADGSISTPSRPAPPPPAYQPPPAAEPPPAYRPPPPAYQPPAYPPPAYPPPGYRPAPTYRPQPPAPGYPQAPTYAGARRGMQPIVPFYGAFGLGGAFISGDLAEGVPADRVYDPQLDIWLEGGMRLTPHLGLGIYLDIGVGEPASEVRAACDALATSCTATTGRFGVLLRHTFNPSAYSTPWVAVGTGFEFGSVSEDSSSYDSGSSQELFRYTGWEVLRLMAGVDLRANPVFGFGLYGGVSFGRYSRFEDAFGEVALDREPIHTTVEAGVRFVLFP